MRREDTALHGFLLIAVIFWGLAFTVIKLALVHMSWVTLTLLRFTFASCIFIIYLAVSTSQPRIMTKDLPMVALIGFCGFTGYHMFLNIGEADPQTTAGTSALVIASAPIFMAILASWRLREKITQIRAFGIVIAFVGLAMMILLSEPGSEFRANLTVGAIFVLPAAIFAAIYAILAKPYLIRYSPFQLTAFALFFGTLFTIPVAIANWSETVHDVSSLGLDGLLPILYLSIFPTFISYGIWFHGLKRMEASAIGAYVYISTLVAVIFGMIILGEAITITVIIGGSMVIGGVYLVERKAR